MIAQSIVGIHQKVTSTKESPLLYKITNQISLILLGFTAPPSLPTLVPVSRIVHTSCVYPDL